MLVIGAVLFSMAALLFRGREMRSNRIYFMCQGMAVLWCSSQILLIVCGELFRQAAYGKQKVDTNLSVRILLSERADKWLARVVLSQLYHGKR